MEQKIERIARPEGIRPNKKIPARKTSDRDLGKIIVWN